MWSALDGLVKLTFGKNLAPVCGNRHSESVLRCMIGNDAGATQQRIVVRDSGVCGQGAKQNPGEIHIQQRRVIFKKFCNSEMAQYMKQEIEPGMRRDRSRADFLH